MLFKKSEKNNKCSVFLDKKRKNRFSIEQKKLEKMVLKLFEKGNENMGSDMRILKQSCKLDKLIVDEMMLNKIEEKYPEK